MATHNEKEIKTNWPFTSGLTAGTTKTHGRVTELRAQDGTNVLRRDRKGIY